MPPTNTAPIHSAPPPRETQNMRAIGLMALGFFSFAACDIQSKVLTETLNPFQIVWFRQSGLVLGILLILAVKGLHILRSKNPVLQISRGVTAVASACCFTIAITYVPLADAVAVSFIAPFMVTILGALVLREKVGIRRWVAVSIGFVGMLIVIRPGAGVFHPAIFLVVAAASFFSLRQILSRWLSGADPVITTVAYTALTMTAILSVALPFVWVPIPDYQTVALLFGLAATAGLGEVLVIRALDIGEAVVLAPLHYSLILWATFYGFVVYSDLPDSWTFLGCGIIMASGLYTLHRERKAAKRK
ncbi:DMT family transporter [Pseudoprimorskyibacter insulae]|uniref:Riboflavin transporter n=1 Tax=Pseudoprimorskyibacter insulae TaxID=1695997 RepID=A0A2R8ANN4_9RHOB|nr:DMT family transporter [Pseudoprimorskyibacter insulae]SPF77625.1 Riboflavin transporter [Pseudoprimorskyibacter insulae]